MQKMTWFRRVDTLSGVGNVKETLKDKKVQEILKADTSNGLVPMQIYEHLKATKWIRDSLQKHFEAPIEKKKGQSSASPENIMKGSGCSLKYVIRWLNESFLSDTI